MDTMTCPFRVRINPGSTVSVFKYMTFFLNVSVRFLFVADLSEQSSAGRSKEQLPSPSGTKFIAPVHTNLVSHERY